MRISVLSGKGGTGKTLVSTNLAWVLQNCIYIDCDIEEPNGAIFLKPEIEMRKDVSVNVPRINEDKCRGCRECVSFCRFNALVYIKDKVKVFKELCHGCGGCTRLCKSGALEEVKRKIGIVEQGTRGKIQFKHGILNSGEPSGVAVIKELLGNLPDNKIIILDCPPGCSCTVMESVKGSNFCILVTEPTIFGVHNLNMVYELCKLLSIPCGIVINKAEKENKVVMEFSEKNKLRILGRIPYDKEIALLSSKGELITNKSHEIKNVFGSIYSNILEVLKDEAAGSFKR